MKIAYVAQARIPTEKAHGIQIMEMCRAFARNGHDVTLVVPRRKNFIQEDPFLYYDIEPCFEIVYVPVVDFFVWVKWLGNSALWLISAWFGMKAKKILKELKPDVIYTRDPFAGYWLPKGPKSVFEAHDFPRSRPHWYRRLWNRYHRVVTVTAGLKERFVRDGGVPDEKIVVAHDAVDLRKFQVPSSKGQVRSELGLPAEAFIAVYAGHMYPNKGVPDLIEAAGRVPEVRVVIVGGKGDDTDNVSYIGRVPHAQVAQYLRAADVAVLPNRAGSAYDERYTSPMKLFEYLAAGRAIVASDLPAVREVLDHDTAELVPPDDPDALAEALRRLSKDQVRVANLETMSRSLAQKYTWEARARSVIADL